VTGPEEENSAVENNEDLKTDDDVIVEKNT
jgi:hypothetical protein